MPTRHRAFTIIELLVVMVLIAILTTVATANYLSAQRRARDNARKTHVSSLATAVETFYASKQRFPGKLNAALDGSANPNERGSDGQPVLLNCEQTDGNGNYYYYYFPLSAADTGATVSSASTPCHKRGNRSYTNGGITYSYLADQFKPYPSWIPELGEFLNPAPIEIRYLGADGNANGAYGEVLGAADNSGNLTRTLVYRRLKNGYTVYARLESTGSGDADVLDGTGQGIPLTGEPQPYAGALSVTGGPIYLVRK